jgi:hypothetical protein
MQTARNSFFITGAERNEFERVNENLHDAVYRPNQKQFAELLHKAEAQRDGERANAECARRDGDMILHDACNRRVAEIETVLATWRQRGGSMVG